MKPAPSTVNVKEAPPAVAELGEMDFSAGRGFAALMVKVCADDVPPPGAGLGTVICAVPAAAISDAGTVAVSWVALT